MKQKFKIFVIALVVFSLCGVLIYYVFYTPPSVEHLKQHPEDFRFRHYRTYEARQEIVENLFPVGTPEEEVNEFAERAGLVIGDIIQNKDAPIVQKYLECSTYNRAYFLDSTKKPDDLSKYSEWFSVSYNRNKKVTQTNASGIYYKSFIPQVIPIPNYSEPCRKILSEEKKDEL